MPDSYKNIIKSMGNYRTGNLDPNSTNAKAIKSQRLACRLYGWVDLNEKNDNYRSPLDCYDPNTGLYQFRNDIIIQYIDGGGLPVLKMNGKRYLKI